MRVLEEKHFQVAKKMEGIVEFSEMIIDIMGKKGPIKVNTYIANHNFFLEEDLDEKEYDKLCDEDVLIIGREGKAIGKTDVRKFLKELNDRKNMPIFNNDRSYYFEGVEKVEKTTKDEINFIATSQDSCDYFITWGS